MGASHVLGTGGAGPLLAIYDDYVEFQANCASFLDAIGRMVDDHETLDRRSAMGIKQFCEFLKERAEELRCDLENTV